MWRGFFIDSNQFLSTIKALLLNSIRYTDLDNTNILHSFVTVILYTTYKVTTIMKKQRISFPALLQAICSAILFASCLLPWLNITSPQESLRGQFNLINMPVQMVSDTGVTTNILPPSGSFFDDTQIVLYVILFFIFINIFIQLLKKIPLLTCYSCLLPTCFSYLFWTRVADCGNYLECAGIGLYLTNIFGTIVIAAAWTDLGRNYKAHRKLFRFCWRWSIACLVLPIVLIPLSGFLRIKTSDIHIIHQIVFMFTTICFIIWVIGIVQIPFLVYAKIVNQISEQKDRHARRFLSKRHQIARFT